MKLRNKLVLSCAALAAVATTAVSTTFAWYVTNTTVTATGVTAGTDAANSTTLQISKNGSTWGPTVDIDIDTGKFNPVSYGKNGNGKASSAADAAVDDKFYGWDATGNAVSTDEAGATDYVQFTLYFRNLGGKQDTVYLKSFELKNTSSALPTQRVLATDGLVKTGGTLKTYNVNLLRALSLKLDKVQNTFTDKTDYNVAVADTAVAATSSTTFYSLEAFYGFNTKADSLADTTNTLGTSANAHTYYNAAKNLTSGIATSNPLVESAALATGYANATYTTTAANAISLGVSKGTTSDGSTAQDATYVKTTWTIFLNGWDQFCFDGVKGQTITLSMGFTTAF